MRVLIKKVDKEIEEAQIVNSLEVLQGIVGGYIEFYPFVNDIFFILNEEGKLRGLSPNFSIASRNGMVEEIVGDVIIVKSDGEDITDLTDEDVEIVKECFK